ncbi:MAG: hypothetical protein K2F73_05135 [Ruminococcus sp.]|nr:hypothetical protein [Ruminococcus sp.]
MSSKALLLTLMAVLTMSAVSCGKDDIEDSVSMSLSESKTTESTTENSTEKTTETTETTTTVSSVTTESGTDTTDVSITTTDTTTTTTATTSAETSQPEETPQQEQNEPSDNNNDENQNNQDYSDNNQQDNNQQQDNNNNDNNGNDIQQNEPQQNEVKFNMDNLLSDASGIISALGNPDYSGQGAACTTNGNDVKIYQYSGLEIQCYIAGDKEYIFQIEITEDKYQTDKGIKVGSTRSEVESVYGTGTESGNYIIYSSGDNEMDIQYNGDTVISILFYTPV